MSEEIDGKRGRIIVYSLSILRLSSQKKPAGVEELLSAIKRGRRRSA